MCMRGLRQTFIENLKYFRKQKGLRQLDLALEIGKSSNYINSVENGKYFPPPETIEQIARRLEVKPAALFGGKIEGAQKVGQKDFDKIEESLKAEVLENISKAFKKMQKAGAAKPRK